MASIGTNDKNKQLQERKKNQFDFWDVQRMKYSTSFISKRWTQGKQAALIKLMPKVTLLSLQFFN